MTPVRVLIADDHAGYREGLARLIAGEGGGLAVAGLAASGAEALALAAELHPDVALVDVRMPGLDGVETCRRLRAQAPEAAVILITGTPDAGLRVAAAAAGAAGLLDKESSPGAIRAALLQAAGRRTG